MYILRARITLNALPAAPMPNQPGEKFRRVLAIFEVPCDWVSMLSGVWALALSIHVAQKKNVPIGIDDCDLLNTFHSMSTSHERFRTRSFVADDSNKVEEVHLLPD